MVPARDFRIELSSCSRFAASEQSIYENRNPCYKLSSRPDSALVSARDAPAENENALEPVSRVGTSRIQPDVRERDFFT